MLEDGDRQMREQLLLENQLNLHTHYLGHGSLSPALLAAVRLATGDCHYLSQVAKKRVTPFEVMVSL